MSLLVDIEKDYGGFHLCSRFETNGGITGLLGASGCGKSQTLRCIAGVQTPDKGRIVLDGVTLYDSEQHINLTPQQRGVGYLFQSYALFPNMTVRANILTGLRREKDAAKKQAAFEHAIHLLKLEGLEDRRPAQLSGGQAQRVPVFQDQLGDRGFAAVGHRAHVDHQRAGVHRVVILPHPGPAELAVRRAVKVESSFRRGQAADGIAAGQPRLLLSLIHI